MPASSTLGSKQLAQYLLHGGPSAEYFRPDRITACSLSLHETTRTREERDSRQMISNAGNADCGWMCNPGLHQTGRLRDIADP